jgi:hypothetical protein
MPVIRYITLCAALIGCAQRPRPFSEVASAVVGVYNEDLGLACSGVRIASDLVLTARHCVARLRGRDCNAYFEAPVEARGVRVTSAPHLFGSESLHAVRIHVPAGNRLCGDDLAVVALATPLSNSAQLTWPNAALVGTPSYHAIGYGALNARGVGLGERRLHGAGKLAQLTEGLWQGNVPVCAGDSGGPALDSDGHVLAILSHAPARQGCFRGMYTALQPHSAWLRSLRSSALDEG